MILHYRINFGKKLYTLSYTKDSIDTCGGFQKLPKHGDLLIFSLNDRDEFLIANYVSNGTPTKLAVIDLSSATFDEVITAYGKFCK